MFESIKALFGVSSSKYLVISSKKAGSLMIEQIDFFITLSEEMEFLIELIDKTNSPEILKIIDEYVIKDDYGIIISRQLWFRLKC